ncbi:hypothetical protein SH2C18_17660 [Clostridium sediminicola]|uniref:aspartyl-phosphate phosphatase Spo0E family protein n=1 Tax=Clostridium sediminicola TaxID=3114879 RepID=UPI0031F266BA
MQRNLLILNQKKDELNKLIEQNSFNLLSPKIIRASQELDKLIYKYIDNHLKFN